MNRLKELRKQKGLTQQGLADEISVSKITVLRWENEERQIKPEKAQQLADFFGVSVGYLLGYSEYRDSQEASFHLNKINPNDPYNLVRARICSILGDDLMEELERQYVTGYDEPDYSNLISFLSAVNQLSYTDEEELLLNYGILPKEDKKIIKNLVSDMAEKVKIANKKEPWEKGF
ncbi:helix-turn-helix transcriptional regulator [Streptococcus mitis]|jgi:XRE family transcriptional regulator|uniref:helix-turn-helix transcriptional regulator n=1 Tax=Streptococcus mitis TaxID=28037 RepID=UPI0039C2FC54